MIFINDFFVYVKYVIIGSVLIMSTFFFVMLFWKWVGFETIENERIYEELEVLKKDENRIVVSSGKGAVIVSEYYIIVQYGGSEYSVKVQKDLFWEIRVGDYIQCEISSKERKNGYKTIGIELDYH